jgi:hypothetical protein
VCLVFRLPRKWDWILDVSSYEVFGGQIYDRAGLFMDIPFHWFSQILATNWNKYLEKDVTINKYYKQKTQKLH